MRDKSPEEIEELKSKLTDQGLEEITEPAEVDEILSRSGTVMIVINSVCSCAGNAVREGIVEAVKRGLDVDHAGTVFAGVDQEATEEVRDRAPDTEPSSPSIYLFRNGNKEAYIPREYTMKTNYEPEEVREKLQHTVESVTHQRAG